MKRDITTTHIVLEFARAKHAGQPHAFRFVPQTYLLRNPGGSFESAKFPWTPAFLTDLLDARTPGRDPETIRRIGEKLRNFLSAAGWNRHEEAITRAAREGASIVVTIRSAAAELYALPWEFVALKSTGQLLGGIPGLLVRYEWPETHTCLDRAGPLARRGRVLFAWSAEGGGVPSKEHIAALQAAFAGRVDAFDSQRDMLAHASCDAIAEALDDAAHRGPPVDVLHLLCHGAAIGSNYGLVLNSASGGRDLVDADAMQRLLAAHAGMLRMIVLAACDSGNTGQPGNYLGSVAQMIHRVGLPVVIASRYPLSTAGSVRFAESFYRSLVREGAPLERAFISARDKLMRDPGQLDWASVQLYSREADGLDMYPLRLETPPAVGARVSMQAVQPGPAAPPVEAWPPLRGAGSTTWNARAELGRALQLEPNVVVRDLDVRLGGEPGKPGKASSELAARVAAKIDALGEGPGAADILVDACYQAISDVTRHHPGERAGAKRILRAVLGMWLPKRYGGALTVTSRSRSSARDACDDMQLDTEDHVIAEVAIARADERPASYETQACLVGSGQKRPIVPRGAVPIAVSAVAEILTAEKIADQIARAIAEQIPGQIRGTAERQRQHTREWLAFFREPGEERDPKHVALTPDEKQQLGDDVLDALKAIYPPLRLVELGDRMSPEEHRIFRRLHTIFREDDDRAPGGATPRAPA